MIFQIKKKNGRMTKFNDITLNFTNKIETLLDKF